MIDSISELKSGEISVKKSEIIGENVVGHTVINGERHGAEVVRDREDEARLKEVEKELRLQKGYGISKTGEANNLAVESKGEDSTGAAAADTVQLKGKNGLMRRFVKSRGGKIIVGALATLGVMSMTGKQAEARNDFWKNLGRDIANQAIHHQVNNFGESQRVEQNATAEKQRRISDYNAEIARWENDRGAEIARWRNDSQADMARNPRNRKEIELGLWEREQYAEINWELQDANRSISLTQNLQNIELGRQEWSMRRGQSSPQEIVVIDYQINQTRLGLQRQIDDMRLMAERTARIARGNIEKKILYSRLAFLPAVEQQRRANELAVKYGSQGAPANTREIDIWYGQETRNRQINRTQDDNNRAIDLQQRQRGIVIDQVQNRQRVFQDSVRQSVGGMMDNRHRGHRQRR